MAEAVNDSAEDDSAAASVRIFAGAAAFALSGAIIIDTYAAARSLHPKAPDIPLSALQMPWSTSSGSATDVVMVSNTMSDEQIEATLLPGPIYVRLRSIE